MVWKRQKFRQSTSTGIIVEGQIYGLKKNEKNEQKQSGTFQE